MAPTKKKTTTTPVSDSSDYAEAQAANADLEHSQGGTTTRDDATDMGVPMLPGSPDEPQGPEDALGPGPKRGDYSKRLGDANYQPHEVVANPDGEDGEPAVVAVPQAPRASDQGDVAGAKGGVDTA